MSSPPKKDYGIVRIGRILVNFDDCLWEWSTSAIFVMRTIVKSGKEGKSDYYEYGESIPRARYSKSFLGCAHTHAHTYVPREHGVRSINPPIVRAESGQLYTSHLPSSLPLSLSPSEGERIVILRWGGGRPLVPPVRTLKGDRSGISCPYCTRAWTLHYVLTGSTFFPFLAHLPRPLRHLPTLFSSYYRLRSRRV